MRRNARRVDANQYLSRVCRVCGLTAVDIGKALSDRPALKPDWGKPAVRNFREEDGNGSYRAILLPEERDVDLETFHHDPEGSTPSRQRLASQPEASLACGGGNTALEA